MSRAHELLKLPDIAEAIARGMAQRLTRVGMKQDSVLHEMSLLSHSRLDWFVIDDDGSVTLAEGAPEGAMGAVQSIKRKMVTRIDTSDNVFITVTVELKLWDKVSPLRLMGRHVGLFPDRTEHTGPGGGPIETVTRVERVIVDPAGGSLALALPARHER